MRQSENQSDDEAEVIYDGPADGIATALRSRTARTGLCRLFIRIIAGDDIEVGQVEQIIATLRAAVSVEEANITWDLSFDSSLGSVVHVKATRITGA